MANKICSDHLVSIGMTAFSENKQKILDEISANSIPVNHAVISIASAEALIHAVATMIENSDIDTRR